MSDKLPPTLSTRTPWEEIKNPIWPMTSFILRRSVNPYLFPAQLDEAMASQALSLFQEAFTHVKTLDSPKIFSSNELTPTERELIAEHFLEPAKLQKSGPNQAIVLDNPSTFLGLLNFDDHLELRMFTTQEDWEVSWNRLCQLEKELGALLDFSFNPRFGYLTSSLRDCGTGLKIRAHLHLPGLILKGQLDESLEAAQLEGNRALSFEADPGEFIGDLLHLENSFSIGIPENEILSSLIKSASHLAISEKKAREELKTEESAHIKDLVGRAFGLLSHSYELHAKETLGALSLLRLGLSLGWVEGLKDSDLSSLYFFARRAHLHHLENQTISQEELPHKRSQFLREKLRESKLTF